MAAVGSAVARLYEALDELAAEDVTGVSLRDDLLELERARARLDAETSRRLRAFDGRVSGRSRVRVRRPRSWSQDTRAARGEAHHRVRVAREVDELDATAAAWAAGAVTTRHVEAIARARHAARADGSSPSSSPRWSRPRVRALPRTSPTWRASGATPSTPTSTATAPGRRCRRASEQDTTVGFDFSRSIDGMGFGT